MCKWESAICSLAWLFLSKVLAVLVQNVIGVG